MIELARGRRVQARVEREPSGRLIAKRPDWVPSRRNASQRVGTRMSSAYQYQPLWFSRSGSNATLARMPCRAGHTPVMSVVWLG